MKDLLIYAYWLLYRRNNDFSTAFFRKATTYVQMLFFILINILSIVFIADSFFASDLSHVNGLLGKDRVMDRLVYIPLLCLPLLIILIIYFRINKDIVEGEMALYDSMDKKERGKKNAILVKYIVLSVVLFALGITSSTWVKWLVS